MLTNPRDGQSRSPNIAPIHMLRTFSSCAIITFFLKVDLVFFRHSTSKHVVTLKFGSGHSRSLKMVTMDCVWISVSVLQEFCP